MAQLTPKQDWELNVAYYRPEGKGDLTDLKNLEYAQKTYGWKPGANPYGTTKVADPVAPATPVTTPVDETSDTTSDGATRYSSELDEYGQLLKERTSGQKSDADIQSEERARIQAQIDTLENYWSQTVLPELQRESQTRLGQSIGLQAAGGLMGSPRGAAQTEKTKQYSAQLTRAERAKIDAKISMLYADADSKALDRAEKQATLLRQDQDAYYSYLSEQQDESKNKLTELFAGGVTLDDLKAKDPEKYKQLLEDAGIDEFMATALQNSNSPSAAKKDIKYETVGNKVIGYYYDDATDSIKQIESAEIPGLSGGGKYKTQVAGGTMLLIPEKFDPNKSIESQIIQYGATGQFRTPTGGGGGGGTDGDRQSIQSDMNSVRGEDGYYDTAKYSQIRENIAVNSPKLLSWFDSTYKPQNVLNPNDSSAQKYFQTGTQQITDDYSSDDTSTDETTDSTEESDGPWWDTVKGFFQ